MAIYHFTVKMISKSKGQSAVACAAYRRADRLFDEKQQESHDYTKKKDVVHSEMLIPNNAPEWAKEILALHATDKTKAAELFWNKVESFEKLENSQLAREIEFALPIELTQQQSIALAREYIRDQFVSRGMVADFSLHWDEGNPHVHVMLTTRELTQEGFGLKRRDWNDRALLKEWRAQWAEYANFHLKMHRHDVRIDHRSYQDQGIDLVPGVHLGKAVMDMERRGHSTELMKEFQAIQAENQRRLSAKPDLVLNKVASQKSIFTSGELANELGRHFSQGHLPESVNPVIREKLLQDEVGVETSQPPLSNKAIKEILQKIEHHESVFAERDLAKGLTPYAANSHAFIQAFVQLKNSDQLIHLGQGSDGKDRFTTQTMFKLENRLQAYTDKLRKRKHFILSSSKIDNALKNYQQKIGKTLTPEQEVAVKHILKPQSITCLVGRAGTGKSFSLGAARAVWESQGLRVLGVALSGVASDGLEKDAGIHSRTIESFRYSLERGSISLNMQDVVVMDEAGMTDSVAMKAVLSAVHQAQAKLVLVGDPAQLQPVGPGATFRAILERIGFAEIQHVYRQKEAWQQQATQDFAAGKISRGLNAYDDHQAIHFSEKLEDSMNQLIEDWMKTRTTHQKNPAEYLMIAHRNEDVRKLNQLARAVRIERKEILEGYPVITKRGEINLSPDDRILFLKNDNHLGVKNGRFATIESIQSDKQGNIKSLIATLDGKSSQKVNIDPKQYNDFTYGYAATVHKVQGLTLDHSFVLTAGHGWNRNLTYVAMTRHRETCHIYANKETHQNINELEYKLSRRGIKDSVLDFPLNFSSRRGINNENLFKRLQKHLKVRLKILGANLKKRFEIISLTKSNLSLDKNQNSKVDEVSKHAKIEFKKMLTYSNEAFEKLKLGKLLATYVDRQLELTELVKLAHISKRKDPLASKNYYSQVRALNSDLNEFAKKAVKHPEIQQKLNGLNRNFSKITLHNQGGFQAIKERLSQGIIDKNDLAAVVKHMQTNLHKQVRVLSQSLDRKGRSR